MRGAAREVFRRIEPEVNEPEDLVFIAACFCAGLVGGFAGFSAAFLLFGRCA